MGLGPQPLAVASVRRPAKLGQMRQLAAEQRDFARRLRRDATPAERSLWLRLRHSRESGMRFTRQLPVGPYVIDLACRKAKLAIELDGGQHADRVAHDRVRSAFLEAQGWRVLRFWNTVALEDPDGLADTILAVVRGELTVGEVQGPHPGVRTADPTPPLPSPSR